MTSQADQYVQSQMPTPAARPLTDAEKFALGLDRLAASPEFIGRLGQEIAFNQRKMQLYPIMLTGDDLAKGAILCKPMPVMGRAVILTMMPLQPNDPGQRVHTVIARHTPIPEAERTDDPKVDYARGSMDVIVYRDHPFDLSQRAVLELGPELEVEVLRQLWEITLANDVWPTSAFFYLTLVDITPAPEDLPTMDSVDEPHSSEGLANGRAG